LKVITADLGDGEADLRRRTSMPDGHPWPPRYAVKVLVLAVTWSSRFVVVKSLLSPSRWPVGWNAAVKTRQYSSERVLRVTRFVAWWVHA
jgi:hypothetical protein